VSGFGFQLQSGIRCYVSDYIFQVDESVKSQKIDLLSFRRKPESSHFNSFWTPAFAGVTGLGLFTRQLKLHYQSFFFDQTGPFGGQRLG
jgi:hypothetical protein